MKTYIFEVNDDEARLIEEARMNGQELWLFADPDEDEPSVGFEFEITPETVNR